MRFQLIYTFIFAGLLFSCGGSAEKKEVQEEATTAPSEKRLLFDGETFAGWQGDTANFFHIEQGAIVGGTLDADIPHNAFLTTRQSYDNFILTLKFKLLGEDPNAGIQFRSERIPNHYEMIGYQADMGQTYWGCLYDESRRKTTLACPDEMAISNVLKPDDWNTYEIRAEGKNIQLSINGLNTVNYTEKLDTIPQSGLIGLQIHAGKPSQVWYKDIEIQELP